MARVEEAKNILKALGLPAAQSNEISALTLIALCALGPDDPWSSARRIRCTVTKGIMDYVREKFAKDYAPNTRETFRRQVLHQFVQGHIADYNPFEPGLATNSPRAHYAITEAALTSVKAYGTRKWKQAARKFVAEHGALRELYSPERETRRVPVMLPDGQKVSLSPGKHNEVQRAIVEEFPPRPARNCCTLAIPRKKTWSLRPRSFYVLVYPSQSTTSCPTWCCTIGRGSGYF